MGGALFAEELIALPLASATRELVSDELEATEFADARDATLPKCSAVCIRRSTASQYILRGIRHIKMRPHCVISVVRQNKVRNLESHVIVIIVESRPMRKRRLLMSLNSKK